MRIFWVTLLLLGVLVSTGISENFKLTSGESVAGELLVSSANDAGIQIKVGENDYKRMSWGSFSQDDLKRMAENPKLQGFVEPFIEVTLQERRQRTEVKITPPQRLELPPKQSLIKALFSSALGLLIVLAIYGANIYAGYEIGIFRGQPTLMACGLSAILPFIGPILLLFLPSKQKPSDDASEVSASSDSAAPSGAATSSAAAAKMAQTSVPPPTSATTAPSFNAGRTAPKPAADAEEEDDDNPMHVHGAAHPSNLHISHEEPAKPKPPARPTQTFQRGQFTFNRRFFETRFAGFLGVTRKESEKDMVLVIKSSRGEFKGMRISKVASSDLHLQVEKGGASEEVMIPFSEIQEIRHQHKDA